MTVSSDFPTTLPGVDVKMSRSAPIWETKKYTSASGYEARCQRHGYPRYRYAIIFNFLRTIGSWQNVIDEAKELFDFYEYYYGQGVAFWYTDPIDGARRIVRFEGDMEAQQILPGIWSVSVNLITTNAATYGVDATVSGPGTIDPFGQTLVLPGNNLSFEMTANSGKEIWYTEVDGEDVGPGDTYDFSNIQADHTIKTYFEDVFSPDATPYYACGCFVCVDSSGVIYLFGGAYSAGTKTCYKWNRHSLWTQLADMPIARTNFHQTRQAQAILNSDETKIYIAGGKPDASAPTTVDIYTIATDTWETISVPGWSIYTQVPQIYPTPDGGFMSSVYAGSLPIWVSGYDDYGNYSEYGGPANAPIIHYDSEGVQQTIPQYFYGNGSLVNPTETDTAISISTANGDGFYLLNKDILTPSGKLLIMVDQLVSEANYSRIIVYDPTYKRYKITISPLPDGVLTWHNWVIHNNYVYMAYWSAGSSTVFMRFSIADIEEDTSEYSWLDTASYPPRYYDDRTMEELSDLPYGITQRNGLFLTTTGKIIAKTLGGFYSYNIENDTWDGPYTTTPSSGGADYTTNSSSCAIVNGDRIYSFGSASPSSAPYSTPSLTKIT